jgi:hypothetical protein
MAPKSIGLFKVLDTVRKTAYKLSLPKVYLKLYLVFNISLLELFMPRKEQDLDSYLISSNYPELRSKDKD